jgi:tetratricopeptide (TPR) repeat protein
VVESAPPEEAEIAGDRYAGSPVEELYAAGAELLGLWHVREATRMFEQAVVADSSYYRAYVKLIECYADPLVGREDSAIRAVELARATRLADVDTTFLIGLEYLFVDRDYASAAALLSRAEKSEVSHENAGYYTALAQFKSGQIEEARRNVEYLLNEDETAGRVVELSIRCAAADGDLGAACEQARELARMYSEEPYPYVILAMAELMSGRPQGAVEFCNNALVLDSRYIPAILARSNLYAADGQFAAARVSFEKLLLFDDPLLRALGHEGGAFVDLLSGRFNKGVEEMDEAIRSAMLAGAVRQGLSLAAQTVGYLCELGQGDTAETVVERWITGFGDIPVSLGKLPIHVLEGDHDVVRRVLMEAQSTRDWAVWMGMMSIDFTEISVLARIGTEEYGEALEILARSTATGAARPGTHEFLRGYAAFHSGEAEEAAAAFVGAGRMLYGLEFPYHGDAVLFVRSLYYLAETSIAAGNEADAVEYYGSFLDYWGDADWDIQAIARAREKLESLAPSSSPN